MPDQTPNLQLPVPLGNENVNRQFFIDLINAIDVGAVSDEQLAQAISGIAIAMIDEFTSTDKTKAPTADALRRGLETKQNTVRLADNYLAASVLVNAALDTNGRAYPDGVSMFKVSSSAGGWPAANGYVLTFRAGSGGYQIFYEMYTGNVQTDKTARQWTRSKRDNNAFWQDWARGLTELDATTLQAYVDNKLWQKHKLTDDAGVSIPVSGNANSMIFNGSYNGQDLVNAPRAGWFYYTVERHLNIGVLYVIQTAREMFGNSYFQRTCEDGIWKPWSEDLFTSVSNGKASVKTAVTGKGGVVTAAGSVPTFAELVAGVNSITLGYKVSPGELSFVPSGGTYQNNSGTWQKMYSIKTNVPGTFRLRYSIRSDGGWMAYGRIYKNGVAYGVLREVFPATLEMAFVEDLYFAAGDTIEFWVTGQNASSYAQMIAPRILVSQLPSG